MAANAFLRLREIVLKFENTILSVITRGLQPELCIIGLNEERQKSKLSNNIKDLLNNGFVWAVPKHRRSLEKRLNRKFGWPKYNWKPLVPKTNLLMCKRCGHFHESYTICGHCYEKVKEESKPIIEAIDNFKLEPINEEMVVLYENEKQLKPDEFWKGQRIVEIPKKRPNWFHSNLLQPTTQKLADTKEIKPNEDLA